MAVKCPYSLGFRPNTLVLVLLCLSSSRIGSMHKARDGRQTRVVGPLSDTVASFTPTHVLYSRWYCTGADTHEPKRFSLLLLFTFSLCLCHSVVLHTHSTFAVFRSIPLIHSQVCRQGIVADVEHSYTNKKGRMQTQTWSSIVSLASPQPPKKTVVNKLTMGRKKERKHTNMSHSRLSDGSFVFHSSVMAVFFVGRQIGLVGFSVSLLRFGPSELPRLN